MGNAVVITGTNSGIGAACAAQFRAAGWEVAGVGRRPGATVMADLSCREGIETAAAALRAWQPCVQALIHCAGDFLVAPMERTPPEEFERIWRITVWARHALTRALLGPLVAGRAAIIHIASLAAHRDFPDETAYMSAMHGVMGLARAQDAELRGQGVRVAVVSPGLVRTPLTERSFPAAVLAGALEPAAIAQSVEYLVTTLRSGGYIPEIFHSPQNST